MFKYKAIVSDFDGTLVGPSFEISPQVKTAIKSYIQAGGSFTIATGRGYQGPVKNICKELSLPGPVIVKGGSEIISTETHSVVWGKYMNPHTLRTLMDELSKENIFYIAEKGEHIYAENKYLEEESDDGFAIVDIQEMSLENVPKILVMPNLTLEKTEALLTKLTNMFSDLHIIKVKGREGGFGIDINDGGASKQIALLEYAQLMKLNPKEIIGVGDSYNDYPLLTVCGLGIAMGNAPQELKEIADHIVGTQEEDGVLEVFKFL